MALLEFLSICESSLKDESCGPISPNELLLLEGDDELPPSRSSGVVGREPECLLELWLLVQKYETSEQTLHPQFFKRQYKLCETYTSIRWALFFRMSSCAPRMAAEPVLPVDMGLAGLLVGEFPSL